MRCKKGRSLVGTPAIQIVPGFRTRNIYVSCAITKDSIRKFVIQATAFKVLTFSDFVDNIISDVSTNNISKAVIILDNVSFHKQKVIREKLECNEPYITISATIFSISQSN